MAATTPWAGGGGGGDGGICGGGGGVFGSGGGGGCGIRGGGVLGGVPDSADRSGMGMEREGSVADESWNTFTAPKLCATNDTETNTMATYAIKGPKTQRRRAFGLRTILFASVAASPREARAHVRETDSRSV